MCRPQLWRELTNESRKSQEILKKIKKTYTLSKALSTHSEGKSTIKKELEGTAVAGDDVNIKLIE